MFAFSGIGQFCAAPEKIQCVRSDFELQKIFCRFLDLLNTRIAEFVNIGTILTDQMIMLLIRICPFKLRLILSELMLGYKSAFEKQLDRVVQRCATYTILLVFHMNIQRLNVEVPALCVNLVENCESFGCFAVTLLTEMIGEEIPYGFPDVISHLSF